MSHKKFKDRKESLTSTLPTASLTCPSSIHDDQDNDELSASTSSDIISDDEWEYELLRRSSTNIAPTGTVSTEREIHFDPATLATSSDIISDDELEYEPLKHDSSNEAPTTTTSTQREIHFDPITTTTGGIHSTLPTTPPKYDRLLILQSSPLAYRDKRGELQPMESIDFSKERETLTKTIFNATIRTGNRIDLDFQPGTRERLGNFLAHEEGRLLHFSVHANEKYLALEDGVGELDRLSPEMIKEWIPSGGKKIFFVFVSACHSISIGESFVDAGVPHVICCRGKCRNASAVVFQKELYSILAGGKKTLLEAFNIAKQTTVPRSEEDQFCLLPIDGDHNVPVFFRDGAITPSSQKKIHSYSLDLPRPPPIFLERNVEQYQLLQSIRRRGFVKVTGPRGVGKSDLVKSACQYMNERLDSFGLQHISWFTFYKSIKEQEESEHEGSLHQSVYNIFDMIRESNVEQHHLIMHIHKIGRELCNRNALLVFDAKILRSQESTNLMAIFIEKLIRHNPKNIKILLIHHEESNIRPLRLPTCGVETITVNPLTFDQTVELFCHLLPSGKICCKRHGIESAQSFSKMLRDVPMDISTQRLMDDIYYKMGEGSPANIHEIAASIRQEEVDAIINLGKGAAGFSCLQNINDMPLARVYSSRSMIVGEQQQLRQRIELAEAYGDSGAELKLQFMWLEELKSMVPEFSTLQAQREKYEFKLAFVNALQDYHQVPQIEEELRDLNRIIDAHEQILMPNIDHIKTRAELEATILRLETEYVEECWKEESDDERAEQIGAEIVILKASRPLRPTKHELREEIRELEKCFDLAIRKLKTKAGRIVSQRLKRRERQLHLEENAEDALGAKEQSSNSSLDDNDQRCNDTDEEKGLSLQNLMHVTMSDDIPTVLFEHDDLFGKSHEERAIGEKGKPCDFGSKGIERSPETIPSLKTDPNDIGKSRFSSENSGIGDLNNPFSLHSSRKDNNLGLNLESLSLSSSPAKLHSVLGRTVCFDDKSACLDASQTTQGDQKIVKQPPMLNSEHAENEGKVLSPESMLLGPTYAKIDSSCSLFNEHDDHISLQNHVNVGASDLDTNEDSDSDPPDDRTKDLPSTQHFGVRGKSGTIGDGLAPSSREKAKTKSKEDHKHASTTSFREKRAEKERSALEEDNEHNRIQHPGAIAETGSLTTSDCDRINDDLLYDSGEVVTSPVEAQLVTDEDLDQILQFEKEEMQRAIMEDIERNAVTAEVVPDPTEQQRPRPKARRFSLRRFSKLWKPK